MINKFNNTLVGQLEQYGGFITPMSQFTPEQIKEAQDKGRVFVCENGQAVVWEESEKNNVVITVKNNDSHIIRTVNDNIRNKDGGKFANLIEQTINDKDSCKGFVGRELTDHEINSFNRGYITVKTKDERDKESNAHHKYSIGMHNPTTGVVGTISYKLLKFQQGDPNKVGVNGITDEALIAIVLDRLRSFNDSKFVCRDNSLAITHLEDALLRLQHRADERARRGVENTRQA